MKTPTKKQLKNIYNALAAVSSAYDCECSEYMVPGDGTDGFDTCPVCKCRAAMEQLL